MSVILHRHITSGVTSFNTHSSDISLVIGEGLTMKVDPKIAFEFFEAT